MKAIGILVCVGLAVGLGGGLATGAFWFHGGEVVLLGGLVGLYGYAVWKRPDAVMNAMIDPLEDEPQAPPGDVFSMEDELRRKDRGEEKRNL